MSITVDWDNYSKQIIRCTVQGRWTWEELGESWEKVDRLTQSITHTADAIIDLSSAAMFPGGSFFNGSAHNQIKDMAENAEAGDGALVIVGANAIIRGMYPVFAGLLGAKARGGIHFADSVETARGLLAKRRTKEL